MAAVATFALVQLRAAIDGANASTSPGIAKGEPVPSIVGVTIDGAPFDLASLRGRPVLVNFWGPSCVPCRNEFPLFKTLLKEHAADGLAIVGILMGDPPGPARDFIAKYGATWPTVLDDSKAFLTAYRVAARPTTYFIDRDGILRSIQIGELTEPEFERQYALISGGGTAPSGAATTSGPTAPGPTTGP